VFFKQRNNQRSWASSHKSGGLVSVPVSGPSNCPKNARDLTGISRLKGNLLSKRAENRRRNKLGVDRHGDWQEQVSPVIILVLFLCYLFYFGGTKFKIIVLHLQSSAQPLEPYL
jgi:hypothetical protein